MSTILLVILVLALLGALPTWPHSRASGLRPVRRPRPCARRRAADGPAGSGPDLAQEPVAGRVRCGFVRLRKKCKLALDDHRPGRQLDESQPLRHARGRSRRCGLPQRRRAKDRRPLARPYAEW